MISRPLSQRKTVSVETIFGLVAMLISKDNVTEFVGLSPICPVRSVTHESDRSEAFRCWGYGNLPALSLQLN
jgi:hypothetical protein